jgi:hypothetical protein
MDVININNEDRSIEIDHRSEGVVFLTIRDKMNNTTTEARTSEITAEMIRRIIPNNIQPDIIQTVVNLARLHPDRRRIE